jgi:two-component system, chemotaxis family, response regulator Rcp1
MFESLPKSLGYLRGFTQERNIQAAESAWRFASVRSSATVAGSGSSLPLTGDPSSSLQSPIGPFEEETSSHGSSPRRRVPIILLVEDNPSDVYVIRLALKKCETPVHLIVASDGEEALSILQAQADETRTRPSLILLDWNLPRISGAEILAHIRDSERWGNIPVIIVTSTSSPAELAEIERLGARYFRKPTDLATYMSLSSVIVESLSRTSGR